MLSRRWGQSNFWSQRWREESTVWFLWEIQTEWKQALTSSGFHFPYPTHVLTLWSWGKCFWADDGATPDKLSLGWICCSFVFWTNYSRGLCKALCVGLFIHLKDTQCSVNASFPCAQDTAQGCLTATCATSALVAFKPRHFLALLMQSVLTHRSWSSAALTGLLPKGSASTDCCTTQLIPTGFACGSHITETWQSHRKQVWF